MTQVELTGTNGSFKNIKLVWLTAFRLVQNGRHGGLPLRWHGGCHYAGTGVATTPARRSGATPARGLPIHRHGGCHYAGTGACHYTGRGPATTPKRGFGKYKRSVKQRSKQAAVVSSKSESPKPLPPAYDHPWRTYGKKINGKPVLNPSSNE